MTKFRFDIRIKGSQVNGNFRSDLDNLNVIAVDALTWVCTDGRYEDGTTNKDPVGGFEIGCFPGGFTDE